MPTGDRPVPGGIARRELRTYAAQGLLTLDEAGPSEDDLRRARRIRRLRRDLGLSYPAIEIVLRLVDRLEAAERRDDRDPHPTTVRITVVGR